MTTKTSKVKTTLPEQVSMVSVRLPQPLPAGVKVVYSREERDYTLAATSKRGLRSLVGLALAGALK